MLLLVKKSSAMSKKNVSKARPSITIADQHHVVTRGNGWREICLLYTLENRSQWSKTCQSQDAPSLEIFFINFILQLQHSARRLFVLSDGLCATFLGVYPVI
jgi:hypothetical protein